MLCPMYCNFSAVDITGAVSALERQIESLKEQEEDLRQSYKIIRCRNIGTWLLHMSQKRIFDDDYESACQALENADNSIEFSMDEVIEMLRRHGATPSSILHFVECIAKPEDKKAREISARLQVIQKQLTVLNGCLKQLKRIEQEMEFDPQESHINIDMGQEDYAEDDGYLVCYDKLKCRLIFQHNVASSAQIKKVAKALQDHIVEGDPVRVDVLAAVCDLVIADWAIPECFLHILDEKMEDDIMVEIDRRKHELWEKHCENGPPPPIIDDGLMLGDDSEWPV